MSETGTVDLAHALKLMSDSPLGRVTLDITRAVRLPTDPVGPLVSQLPFDEQLAIRVPAPCSGDTPEETR